MTSDFPSKDTVKTKVQAALASFLANDGDLLVLDANERAITHKLAEALQLEFNYWHVDCEYNRKEGRVIKTLPRLDELLEKEACVVDPDIIVHHRGTNHNLLVIEVKKTTNNRRQAINFDKKKLRAFVQELDYKFALFIMFDIQASNSEPYNCQWYREDFS